jgi:hypothetical protein
MFITILFFVYVKYIHDHQSFVRAKDIYENATLCLCKRYFIASRIQFVGVLHAVMGSDARSVSPAITLQCRDDQPLTFDLGQGRTQHLLQQHRVVGQIRWDREHIPELNRRCDSVPMNLS